MQFLFSIAIPCLLLTTTYVFGANDNDDMVYVPLPNDTSPGGKCMDGTMAGYYIRRGAITNTNNSDNNSSSSVFVIYLKGGGACMDKESCDKRSNTSLGSSNFWPDSMIGTKFQSQDCNINPDFCNTTAVYITSDTHRGMNVNPSEEVSFGYYFDGHLNFIAIIEHLVNNYGLGNADYVLLTGGSAGSIGAIFNVDWLAERLQNNAIVKAVPYAGWYSPGALDTDLPIPYPPSDFGHFAREDHGNKYTLINDAGLSPTNNLWKIKEMLSPDCLAALSDDEWWACTSSHFAYKYIKSNIFVVHTQYDKNQIFEGNGAPTSPVNDTELDTVKRYIQMWGEATRQSLQQIIVDDDDDDVFSFPTAHEDGVFSASCITHGTPQSVMIGGYGSMEIIGDWFFERGQLREHYKLIEECTPLEGNEDYVIPCNPSPICAYKSSTNDDDYDDGNISMQKCAQQLMNVECLQSLRPRVDCMTCARDNQGSLQSSGVCSRVLVMSICAFAEKNVIPSGGLLDGEEMDTNITLVDNIGEYDEGVDDNKVGDTELDNTIDSSGGSSGDILSKSTILASTLSALFSVSCFYFSSCKCI